MTVPSRLRPLCIRDIFDAGFRLYREHFFTLLSIVAILHGPIVVAQSLVQFISNNTTNKTLNTLSAWSINWSIPYDALVVWPAFSVSPFAWIFPPSTTSLSISMIQHLVIQNLVVSVLTNTIACSYLGRPISIRSISHFTHHYLSLILASLVPFTLIAILSALIISYLMASGQILRDISRAIGSGGYPADPPVLIGMLLVLTVLWLSVILLALLFYTRFLLVPQAIILEGCGLLTSLSRSWQLTSSSLQHTLAIVVPMSVLTYILAASPATVVIAVLLFKNDWFGDLAHAQLLATIASQIGMIIVLPLQSIVYTLFYYDVCIRTEGYDLELGESVHR